MTPAAGQLRVVNLSLVGRELTSGTRTWEAIRLERQGRLVHLNREIRRVHSTAVASADLPCDFVCECGDPDCHEHFPLSPPLFDDLKEHDIPLLANGHPVSLARRARQAARELPVNRARRLRGLMLLTIHLHNTDEARELAAHLGELVEITQRAGGTDASMQVTHSLTATLSHIREWAAARGLGGVEVAFLGQTRTLAAETFHSAR